MAKTAHRSWFRIALARAAGAPVLVAAPGEHLGAAIALAEHHVSGSWVVAAEQASEADIPLGESVGKSGKQGVVELDSASAANVATFAWPIGVVPQLAQAATLAGTRRGYAIRPDPTLFVVEAVTEREHLGELFLGMVERLPAADNLEIKVLEHYEEPGPTEVWLTSRVNAKKIIAFLDERDAELFGNGHIEIAVYIRDKHATLRLTEHKTVVFVADDRALADDVARWLADLEIPRIADTELVTIARAPHFHYRPAKSRDRVKFGEALYRQRLRKVATVRANAPVATPREPD